MKGVARVTTDVTNTGTMLVCTVSSLTTGTILTKIFMENQAEHAEVSLVDVALVLPQASIQYHKCTTSDDPVAEDWEIMRLSP